MKWCKHSNNNLMSPIPLLYHLKSLVFKVLAFVLKRSLNDKSGMNLEPWVCDGGTSHQFFHQQRFSLRRAHPFALTCRHKDWWCPSSWSFSIAGHGALQALAFEHNAPLYSFGGLGNDCCCSLPFNKNSCFLILLSLSPPSSVFSLRTRKSRITMQLFTWKFF